MTAAHASRASHGWIHISAGLAKHLQIQIQIERVTVREIGLGGKRKQGWQSNREKARSEEAEIWIEKDRTGQSECDRECAHSLRVISYAELMVRGRQMTNEMCAGTNLFCVPVKRNSCPMPGSGGHFAVTRGSKEHQNIASHKVEAMFVLHSLLLKELSELALAC